MPDKIGKYHVLGRIGRGGMGMILKAHDPVLNRPVALKVISNDIEVTDELRARFYREAQACARLSHPNIVTVYDMGEDDGRLFIVMELLEGEELRRLFSPHKSLPLEDKLAIMSQVCDGLHYAHQKGIVHRDIKPGNIMVLGNGQVKILDFGIAQIATEGGMTRTGLIMGTLRYISPEQVRGHADHRSDMFSVGSVFYEFLGSRPSFAGDDAMQLLEQLRTEVPPLLNVIDPAIPLELATIVERAMRKDPAERFENLEQMRAEIERVRRDMEDEAHRLGARVRAQRDQLLALQAALAEQIGPSGQDETVTPVPERPRLTALQAVERELGSRIQAVQARLARAETLAPAMQRGLERLAAARFADAIIELEAAVADMPEHSRAREALEQAREALEQARARAEAERRARLADTLVHDARAALEQGDDALCLEMLNQADDIPPPAEVVPSIATLRRTAEARLAAQEAARRARQQAEGSRDRMAEARRAAEAQAPAQFVTGLWAEAESQAGQAHAAFARDAYDEADLAFDVAAAAYRQAEEAAREMRLRQRETAEQARDEMTQARAQAASVEHFARELWAAAEAKTTEAESALSRNDVGRAIDVFSDATRLYRRAQEAAEAARESERRRAGELRDLCGRAQRDAEVVNAQHYAAGLWNQASARSTEAESAFRREQYAKAIEVFDAALTLYRQAEKEAQEARRHERDDAEQGRQAKAEARRTAIAADAATHAPAEWQEAEGSATSGDEAFARESYAEASRVYDHSVTLYHRAEEHARDVVRALEIARGDAERAREASALGRRAAAAAQAERYASEPWQAGESTEAQASAAVSRQDYRAARAFFVEARRQYSTAVRAAGVALEAETRRLNALVRDARRLLESGDVPACMDRLNDVLALRPGYEPAERLRSEAAETQRRTELEGRATETTLRDQEPVAPEAESVPLESPGRAAVVPAAYREAVETAAAPATVGETPSTRTEPVTAAASPAAVAAPMPMIAVEETPPSHDFPTKLSAQFDAQTVQMAFDEPAVKPSATLHVHPEDRPSADPESAERESPSAPRRRTPWPWRRLGAATLGALAAMVVLVLYLRPSPPPTVAPVKPPVTVAPPRTEPGVPRAPEPPPGRDLAEDLRKRMIAAREEAVQAGVERLAPSAFGAAAEKAREAEASMGRQDMVNAQQRYNEAIAAFGQAKAEAIRAATVARKEGDVRIAASRAAEARRAAEVVDAPKLARGVWTTADSAQRKAEESLKQQTFDRAQSLFGEAEKSFRAAAKAASESAAASTAERERIAALKLALDEAEQSRRTAIQTRQGAEQADAPRLASRTFVAAQQKQSEGDASLNRQDSASAKLRFQEAQQAYRQAAQEAERAAAAEAQRVAALQRQQTEAEQARDRMMSARRAAEQSTAARQAAKLIASAQNKEGEASAALGRSDFSGAARLFGDARADYQAAVQEAKRETEREQRQLEQSRATMLARREEALGTGADRLAKDAFDAAQAKQTQADELVTRQNLAAAQPLYRDAAERYSDAGRQAKTQQEKLQQAKLQQERLQQEKLQQEKLQQEKPDPRRVEPPPQPKSPPEKQEARRVEPTPPSPRPDEEVRSALASYVRGFEAKDVALLQEVRPGLKPDEVKRLQESFNQSKEYRVSLKVDSLEVRGDQAVVKGRREDSLTSKGGQSFRNESSFTYRLKRAGARWIIDAVN